MRRALARARDGKALDQAEATVLLHARGGDLRMGFLWYIPVVLLCWLLGLAVEHFLSTPCERWLKGRMLDKGVGRPEERPA